MKSLDHGSSGDILVDLRNVTPEAVLGALGTAGVRVAASTVVDLSSSESLSSAFAKI